MNFKIGAALMALSIMSAAAPAMAATTLVSSTCTLSVGASCLFKGNINLQQTGNNSLGQADAAYNGQSPTPSPLLDLADMAYKADVTTGFGANQMSGTVTASFLVSYYAVKAGNYFDLFEIAPSTTFDWSTAGISVGNGRQPAISHLEYFGSSAPSAAPEPATWAMMLLGIAGLGTVLRRQRTCSTQTARA